MTYQELLQYGILLLQEHQVPDAALDARYLLEWAADKTHAELLLCMKDSAEEKIVSSFTQAIDKRSRRIPLQQITHEQMFMGYVFYVNEHVLVPRQDTEIVVETAYNTILKKYGSNGPHASGRPSDEPIRILDLCCGSGCIGISLAKMLQNKGYEVLLTLADLSEKALEAAAENTRRLACPAVLVQGDLFENVRQCFSVIVSNPPYIRTDAIRELMPEVRDHEPYLALDGKEDGLYFYRKIMQKIDDYIEDDGYVFFEIGFDQAEDLRKIFIEQTYEEIQICKDLTGHDRVAYARHSCGK
ncbi:MAG: peptide chain release factor N(5)-glutamine methyltransferase [Lachnospiraceae bacterium]|nr:peptide chain release factor N(5)-glutamine methyltransferase [Lachnospiraceae bacterium]